MTTVAVSGFTTPDIYAAIAAAGVGGTVLFSNAGTYDSDGLTASVANQTWILERGAKILRNPASTTNLLTLSAPGLRIRGGILDGNRENAPNPGQGITAFVDGCNLDLEDVTLQNVNSWGVSLINALVSMRRTTIKNTTLACFWWRVTGGSGMIAPQLYNCTFDRSQEPGAAVDSGCVLIGSSTGTSLAITPRVVDCEFLMPYTSTLNTVLLEFLWCQRGTVRGGRFAGGRIGFSNAESIGTDVTDGKYQSQNSYSIEMGGRDNIVTGNYGTGSGACLDGISVNHTHSGSLKVIGNDFTGYTRANVFDPASRMTAQWAN